MTQKQAKSTKLLKSGAIVSGFTFLSRIFGLIRDILLAATFGGSLFLDAFLVAFKIPNFFRRILAEGAFVQAFIPIVVELESETNKDEQSQHLKEFLAHSLGFMLLLLTTITALGIIFSRELTLVFAAGFAANSQEFALSSSMLQITFSYIFFITITAYFMALQNSINKFALPAFTPVLLNLSLIFSVWFISPMLEQPIMAAAWAVFFGGLFQLLLQLPAVYRSRLLYPPKLRLRLHPTVRRLLKQMAPIVISGGVVQINLIIDLFLASFLVVGSITWLSFAERLIQLPLGIFGIALTTIMMPYLSRLNISKNDYQEIRDFISWSVRLALIIALPSCLGLIIISKELLTTIYYYGEFSVNDVNRTSLALAAYAIGLPSFIMIKVLSSVFFARQDTKTPLKASILAVIVGVIASLSLVWSLKHVGLALATSISASFNLAVLSIILFRRGDIRLHISSFIFFGRLMIALGLMTLFLIFYLNGGISFVEIREDDWFNMSAQLRLINIATIVILAAMIYFAALRLSGVKFTELLHR